MITLLKEKIEASIKENKIIVVNVSNHFMGVRNTIYIEDYEIEKDNLYLNSENFELHIDLNKITSITHDNLFDDEFIIVDKSTDTEIRLCFLLV